MSVLDDMSALAITMAKLYRGPDAAPNPRDHTRAAALMKAIETDPELEAIILRQVSRPMALVRAYSVAHRLRVRPEAAAVLVDAVLQRDQGGR